MLLLLLLLLERRLTHVDEKIVCGGEEKIGIVRHAFVRQRDQHVLTGEFLLRLFHRRKVFASRPFVLTFGRVFAFVQIELDDAVVGIFVRQKDFVVDQIEKEIVQRVLSPGLIGLADQPNQLVFAQKFAEQETRFARAADVRQRFANQEEKFVRNGQMRDERRDEHLPDLQRPVAMAEAVDRMVLSDDDRRARAGRRSRLSRDGGRRDARRALQRFLQNGFLAKFSTIVVHRIVRPRHLNDRRRVEELPMFGDQLREMTLLLILFVEIRKEIFLRQTMNEEQKPFDRGDLSPIFQ